MLLSANQIAASAQTETASARPCSNDQHAFAMTQLIHCWCNVDTGLIDFSPYGGQEGSRGGEERKGGVRMKPRRRLEVNVCSPCHRAFINQ